MKSALYFAPKWFHFRAPKFRSCHILRTSSGAYECDSQSESERERKEGKWRTLIPLPTLTGQLQSRPVKQMVQLIFLLYKCIKHVQLINRLHQNQLFYHLVIDISPRLPTPSRKEDNFDSVPCPCLLTCSNGCRFKNILKATSIPANWSTCLNSTLINFGKRQL